MSQDQEEMTVSIDAVSAPGFDGGRTQIVFEGTRNLFKLIVDAGVSCETCNRVQWDKSGVDFSVYCDHALPGRFCNQWELSAQSPPET